MVRNIRRRAPIIKTMETRASGVPDIISMRFFGLK